MKISLRAKAGVPKTLVKQKLRLHSLYFPQNTLMLTESTRGEYNDLHSILRLRAPLSKNTTVQLVFKPLDDFKVTELINILITILE